MTAWPVVFSALALAPGAVGDMLILSQSATTFRGGAIMKVRASVKRICDKCKLIKRKGVVRIICEDPRHKQRQG